MIARRMPLTMTRAEIILACWWTLYYLIFTEGANKIPTPCSRFRLCPPHISCQPLSDPSANVTIPSPVRLTSCIATISNLHFTAVWIHVASFKSSCSVRTLIVVIRMLLMFLLLIFFCWFYRVVLLIVLLVAGCYY